MRDDSEAMCYVGKAPCGHYKYACVDSPDMAGSMAKDIAKLIRSGWTVERKPVQWVRDGNLTHCNCSAKETE